MRKFILVLACLFLVVPCSAKTIQVDDSATGANDVSSWTTACNYSQNALTAVSNGDEIQVVQGTYKFEQVVDITSGDRMVLSQTTMVVEYPRYARQNYL